MSFTGAICSIAHEKKLLDIPNFRSSHNRPTPHGGGISIIISFLALIALGYIFEWINLRTCLAIAIPGTIIGIVGLADDIKRIRVLIRLFVQIACVTTGLLLLPISNVIIIFDKTIEISGWNIVIAVIALVWLVNLFNFMDGIDGLAGTEFVTVLISGAVILSYLGDNEHIYILLLSCMPVLGFLLWNWPPAKIFMGDAGSGFLGFLLGVGGFYICAETELTLWSWIILLGVFIVDASWTLIIRISSKQNCLEPHCKHAYQKIARLTGRHLYATLGALTINIVWLLPLALLSILYPAASELIVLIAYAPLIFLCYYYQAGK